MTFDVRSREQDRIDIESNAKLLIELRRVKRRCFDISIWRTIGGHKPSVEHSGLLPLSLPFVLVAFCQPLCVCVSGDRLLETQYVTHALLKVESAYLSMRMQISAVACELVSQA